MTNKPTPTPAQIQEACDLMNDLCGRPRFWRPDHYGSSEGLQAASHLIAERNAERQRVSEVAASVFDELGGVDGAVKLRDMLLPLILPDPEPTPEEVWEEIARLCVKGGEMIALGVERMKDVLARRGSEIAKIKGGDNGAA